MGYSTGKLALGIYLVNFSAQMVVVGVAVTAIVECTQRLTSPLSVALTVLGPVMSREPIS